MHAWAEICHLLLQSSKSPLTGFLCSIGWRIRLSSNTPHTNSNSKFAIFHNNYILLLSDLCSCVHTKKNSVVKPQFFSEQFESPRATSNLEKSNGLVHCLVKNAAVSQSSTTEQQVCPQRLPVQYWLMLSSNTPCTHKFDLARLKKIKIKKYFSHLATFWFGTFGILFSLASLGVLFIWKHLKMNGRL